jgi:glutaminase
MDVSELALRRQFDALEKDEIRDRLARNEKPDGTVMLWRLLSRLGQAGIDPSEPRVMSAVEDFEVGPDKRPVAIDYDQFTKIASHGDGIIERALQGDLAVPPKEFGDIVEVINEIHADLLDDRTGEVADYIPTLRDADPDKFGIAICTADGQMYSIGDTTVPFSAQSTSKVFNLAMAYEELGPDAVHQLVGVEQSGGVFNDPVLSLDEDSVPRNPMINAGAIGTLAQVRAGQPDSARIRAVLQTWNAMMGQRAGTDIETFYAERETGDGNRRLAGRIAAGDKLMSVSGSDQAAIDRAAEFYFQVCSLEVDAMRLAAAGATLANGGRAPFSGEQVFSADTTGRVLSVMGHSGMYDGSGRFAQDVGLPAKSGVSGNVMLVVPQKRMAVVVFSPRLDAAGNSVRGIEVCRRLSDELGWHPYKGLGAERGRDVAQPDAARAAEAARTAETAAAIRQAIYGTGGGSRIAAAANVSAAPTAGKMDRRFGKQSGNQL